MFSMLMLNTAFQAVENVWSIKTRFPMFPADEIYNCICTSPYDKNDITWSQYSKEQCAVSDELDLEFHCILTDSISF